MNHPQHGTRPDRAPDRPADANLFGEGCSPPDSVRERMDAAAYVEFFVEAMPDDDHPLGWWHILIWNEA